MHIKLLSVAIAATILTGCGTLAGGGADGEEIKATESYIASSSGGVVGVSNGCLHSSKFDDETKIGSCEGEDDGAGDNCLLYTSPSPRD